jgi:hypothetical protein
MFVVASLVLGRVFRVVSNLDSSNLPTATVQEDKTFRATYNLAEKQLAVRSLQLAAGYGVGFFCVVCGVILAWCGVSGQVDFKMSDGTRNISLQTGSIGGFIVLCGAVLLSVSMFSRPIKVESTSGIKFESSFGGDSEAAPHHVEL